MQILLDNFNGAAGPLTGHAADSGHTWSGGAFAQLNGSGQLATNGANSSGAGWVVSTAAASGTLSVTETTYTTSAAVESGVGVLGFASSNGANFYMALVSPLGNVSLWKKVGGTLTNIVQVGSVATTGANRVLRLEVSAGSQVIKLDGATILSRTDTALDGSAGKFYGVYRDNSATSAVMESITGSDNVGGALIAGVASVTGVTASTASLSSTAPSGGTSPYTYQWYRSTTSGFTPNGTNLVTGATALTLSDSGLTAGTTYYYKIVYTDSASATVTSNEASASPTANNDVLASSSLIRWAAPKVMASNVATGISSGRMFDLCFTGDACTLLFDVSNGAAVDIQYRIDAGPLLRTAIAATLPLTLTYTGTKAQTHTLEVWANVEENTTGLWASATGGWKFVGVRLQTGKSLLALPSPRGYVEFLGDSITQSVRALYTGTTSDRTVQNAGAHWPQLLANLLGRIPITRGFGATGLAQAGSGGVPQSKDNFPYVYSGQTYTPAVQPDLVVINQGTNGNPTQADYQTYLQVVRAARPNARILFLAPPGYNRLASIQAAITAVGDAKTTVFDLTPVMSALGGEDFTDTIGHVGAGGAERIASLVGSNVAPLLASDASTGTGTYPTADQIATAVWAASSKTVTGGVVALTSAYDAAKTASSQASNDLIYGVVDTEIGTLLTNIAAVKAKTDNLPVAPAAVGSVVTLDLTQPIPTSNTAQTLGDALNAARAQGFGSWRVDGTSLKLLAADNATVVKEFALDDALMPLARTST